MISASEIQETLKDLIKQFGIPNDSNTQMYSSVLSSALANDPREAGLLQLSLDMKIPDRLNAQKGNPQIISQLVQEITSTQHINNHASKWIVNTWAKVMGMNVPSYQPPVQQPVPAPQPVRYQNPGSSYPQKNSKVPQYGEYSEKTVYEGQHYQQSPSQVETNTYSSPPQGYQEQMLCPQCRTPLPKQMGERCTRCGYTATQYGGFLRRFVACFIDGIILGIISIIFLFLALASFVADASGIIFILILIVSYFFK